MNANTMITTLKALSTARHAADAVNELATQSSPNLSAGSTRTGNASLRPNPLNGTYTRSITR